MKYGLDFGTTNTSIAIQENNTGKVLPTDTSAADPRVTRTMLYFLRRELIISPHVPPKRLNALTFTKDEITYQGEQKLEIGQQAVNHYLADNKFRQPGTVRKILTGKYVTIVAGADPVAEFYHDIDYGVGRFIQSMKTALKSQSYKGTSIFGDFYTLEDLISTFVGKIKQQADFAIKQQLDQVVVGRPVHFSNDPAKDQAAQDRLELALKRVGFNNIQFVFEPIAAAEQFIATSKKEDQLVFVFDFGGGTLDTALVRTGKISQSTGKISSKVLAADGDYIGGDLLNSDILQKKLGSYFGSQAVFGDSQLTMPYYIYEALSAWYSIPSLNNPEMMDRFERLKYKNSDPEALQRLIYLIQANLGFDLYEAIEIAKKQLSSSHSTVISFSQGPININQEITRAEFEEIIAPRVAEIRETVLRTLKTAAVSSEEVDVVVRTGGSSLIPAFETMLADIFGREKIKQFETFTSIAAGLALTD